MLVNKNEQKEQDKYFVGYGTSKTSKTLLLLFPISSFHYSSVPSSFTPLTISKESNCYVNGIDYTSYFYSHFSLRISGENIVDRILSFCSFKGSDVMIFTKISGGGIHSQLKSFNYALADAILNLFLLRRQSEEYAEVKSVLRKHDLVAVDKRQKERKKAGQPKARAKRQFSKR